MKKYAVLVCAAMAATFAWATTITNYVVVVSNIYNRISEEHWITNNVKNSHSNYYFTNHTHTVEHETLVVSKTNLTVNADVSQAAIAAARAQADRAEDAVSDASDFASAAAGSASSAESSASSADSSASQAASQRSSAASECASALATINARIAWFDQHSGETITQINITSNNYYAEDSVARSGVAANASAISSLEGRVGNNISALQSGLATANGRIDSNASAISSLQGRVGNVESYFNADLTTYSTQVVYKCDSVPEWSFRLDSSVYTTSVGTRYLTILDQNRPSSIGTAEILSFAWHPLGYNYGTEVGLYVSGTTYHSTINEFFTFPNVFTISQYTFRKYSEKFVPNAACSNLVVKAVSLFGDSWNPKKSDGEMLAETIDGRTADLNRRVEALEDNDTDMPEAIGMYTRHRPSVTYSYYYTYGGSKLLYTIKVYTDRATVVESDAESTTYAYDYSVLYYDSSAGSRDGIYVYKKIYNTTPALNEIITRIWRSSGYSMYKLRAEFSSDIHDLVGSSSVGQRLVCYSNTLGYFVMFLDGVDSSQAKELQYYVSADFNVYDSNGSKIGRVMRDTDWTSLSNWVERVFQKK